MAKSKLKSLRKSTGGRYSKLYRKKKLRDSMGIPVLTTISEKVVSKIFRKRGGSSRIALVSSNYANLTIGKKTVKVKIKTVLENPASRHFVRQNILSKGAIIETEKGKARITSRPSKDNVVNAVLVK
ncbi:30S ribosomal protein S8e [Candidatus Woesearchaeota archaeon]|jgi:small subunit ribosomal protein S8e|nr:30S ribosomal protein S8e [Candidatus Woesearchaeota archaeon]|tara:strand:- start:85 stop:465 length:381 start_codon:yes stop_codon:yes gene_type:complete